ncbi:MAG: DMT family transporter [Chloroflexi bacterium]|nr:DMT family transporter [Chloroflexota bacterium]
MGEAAGLLSAFFVAVSAIIIRSYSMRASVWSLNAILALFVSLFYVVALLAFGQAGEVWRMPRDMVALSVLSGVTGMVLGGSAYIKGLELAGVARAFPIQMSCYSLFTLLLAFLLLDEAFSPPMLAGVALVLVGLYLVGGAQKESKVAAKDVKLGIVLSVGAGAIWALTTFVLRIVLKEESVVAVNFVRMPAGALILVLLTFLLNSSPNIRRWSKKDLAVLGVVGFIAQGMGSFLFVFALATAGAAKTAILSSTSPLFALPMAVLLSKERVTSRLIAGTALTVSGIALIVL